MIDVHDIKPMVCLLFPLSFDRRTLEPAAEFTTDDLVCQGPGANRPAAADLADSRSEIPHAAPRPRRQVPGAPRVRPRRVRFAAR